MADNPDDTLRKLMKQEAAASKQTRRWSALSDVGFIGLIGTEIPQFLNPKHTVKPSWRLPLFVASSVSIVVGVVMNWCRQGEAEKLHEAILATEDARSEQQCNAPEGGWGAKIAAESNPSQGAAK